MCKHCENGCDIEDIDYIPIGKILNNKYVLYMKNDDTDSTEINLCPMCGRDLREATEK